MSARSVGSAWKHAPAGGVAEKGDVVRRIRRLALALALCMLAGAPLCAQAAPFPPRLNYAYELAIHYWGEQPTACTSIDKEIVPPGSLGSPEVGAISGASTQVPPGAAPASLPCILWIDRAYAEPIIFDLLCAVMVHHVGHLLGNEYSPDPWNVMSPTIPVPPLCELKGRQATRLYMLRLKYHWLQTRHSPHAAELRRQTLREMNAEAQRFWSMAGPA